MAGESARRKYEELKDERRQRLRDNWPTIAVLALVAVLGAGIAAQTVFDAWWLGMLLALIPLGGFLAPSEREVAWRKGAEGEQTVGRALDQLGPTCRALHDRRIPGSRANIDHILVAPTGVWTVDAKNYKGKIETRRRGAEVWVNGRNRSKLLAQAQRQTEVVAEALVAADLAHVPVRPALCFLGVEWPLLLRPTTAGEVTLLSPRRLRQLTEGAAVLPPSALAQVAAALDQSLRPPTSTEKNPPRSTPPPVRPTRPRFPSTDGSPDLGDLKVKPWKRHGKNRLYVNHADGSTLGYVDLETNDVIPVEEQHRDGVRNAVTAYLRGF